MFLLGLCYAACTRINLENQKKVKKIKARCWAHVRLFLLLKYCLLNVKPVIRDREKTRALLFSVLNVCHHILASPSKYSVARKFFFFMA